MAYQVYQSPSTFSTFLTTQANIKPINPGIININIFFHSENGEFSLLPGEHYTKWVTKINVFVFVPCYAPEIREFKLQDPNTYDIGDVIVKSKPAAITGRVIDHEYNPVSARVTITMKDGKSTGFLLRSENDKTDGVFEFSDLPQGKYIVEAHTQLKSLKSELFELRSGENYTLPDLVAVETNAVIVLFKFVLPDGSPAANARVNYFTRLTDKNGHIEKKMDLSSPRTYDKLKLRIEDKYYCCVFHDLDLFLEYINFFLCTIEI